MKQLFYHAQVVTMEEDEQGQIKTAEAVLTENGKILEVGEEKYLRVLAGDDCEQIDCAGKTLLPAFIDSHSHITALAQSLGFCDLSGADSFEEIRLRMIKYAGKNPLHDGQWLVGFGYDHNDLKEHIHPDRRFLDALAEEILQQDRRYFPGNEKKEIFLKLSHASGHMGVMSSAALEFLSIDSKTPNPSGGSIGHEDNGEPNGYLEENAFIQTTEKIPQPSKEELMQQLKQAQKIYHSYGITTIQDGLTKQGQWELLKEFAQNGGLKSDVVCYADLKENRSLISQNPEYAQGYRDHLRLGGYKIFLDGSPQGKTAWLTEPYQGEQEYCGYPIYTDEQVEELVKEAVQDNRQLLAHCNGDAAAEQYLNACCKVGDTAKIRPVMIHAQLLRPDQLPKVKRAGMIPSYFVAHTWFWGDIHLKNLGEKRAKKISPLRSTADMGIVYTLHQDTPVIPPDMMRTIWCAVNRKSKQGCSMGQEERISVQQALKGVTINAAYQYFEEGEKGSIKKGKAADFVLLSENPLTVSSDRICEVRVLATFYRGEKVYNS